MSHVLQFVVLPPEGDTDAAAIYRQARELLRSARRRRMAREMGSVMDQMENLNLNLQSGDAPVRPWAAAQRPDVNNEFSRLSLTSGGGDENSNLPSQPPGGAGGC